MHHRIVRKPYKCIQQVNFVVAAISSLGIFGAIGGYELNQKELGSMVLQILLFVLLIVTQIIIFAFAGRIEELEMLNRRLIRQKREWNRKNRKECSQSPARHKHSDNNTNPLYQIGKEMQG